MDPKARIQALLKEKEIQLELPLDMTQIDGRVQNLDLELPVKPGYYDIERGEWRHGYPEDRVF